MKELYQEYDVKMQKTIEVVVSDFAGVRAGRANAAVLDKITVRRPPSSRWPPSPPPTPGPW